MKNRGVLRIVTGAVFAGAALPSANAILAAPNSPCESKCGNSLSSTATDEVVCSQNGYSSGSGQIFKSCVECELTSTYSKNNDQTDVQAMLYNLRFATSYCIFGIPDNKDISSTPCITSKACGPFRDAIVFGNASATNLQSYDYCVDWPVNDQADFQGCTECLQAGQQYLANFITVLHAGCQQQPVPGTLVGIEGDPFSTGQVNITDGAPIATPNPDWFDNGPLDLEAKVGIAVGGFVLLLILLGCGIVWNGKRRRRAFLRTLEAKNGQKGWPSPAFSPMFNNHSHSNHGYRGEVRDTSMSQRPLRGWDDSPMTVNTEATFPQYFSPYSSQYNSPVNGPDAVTMPWPDATLAANAIGLAVSPGGGNQGYREGRHGAESYELHEVDSAGGSSKGKARMGGMDAPVLAHPGYGRKENSPSRTYNLTEDDAKKGGAF